MKILKNKEIISQIRKYISISLLGYAFVFGALYLLVSIFKINETISFLIVYGISYVMLYSLQLKYLFNTNHSNTKFLRFCFFLLVFYLLANLIFNLCVYMSVNYLIATLATIIILTPLRFIVSKYYIYK